MVSEKGITRIYLLRAAMSNSQGILVVATTDTCSLQLLTSLLKKHQINENEFFQFKPSINRRNSVFILRSVSLSLPFLLRPIESISSKMMIEGLFSLAISKSILRSLYNRGSVMYFRNKFYFSLSPINFEVISARETQKQVASISVAMA